jgi:hypothetical protein
MQYHAHNYRIGISTIRRSTVGTVECQVPAHYISSAVSHIDLPGTDWGMCHISIRRRIQVTPVYCLKPQPVPLPNNPHVCILFWSSFLPPIRVMLLAKILIDCESYTHTKAGTKNDKKNDQAGMYLVPHVVSLLQGHGVDLSDMHRSRWMVLSPNCAVRTFFDGNVMRWCEDSGCEWNISYALESG